MSNTQVKTKNLILCGLFTALMAICSWIAIPTTVPFTLQTFAVFLVILLLGPKYSAITVTVYILIGIVGLPVFAGFQAGAGIIAGPYGGYILGFIPECILSGIILKTRRSRTAKMLSLILGLFVCYASGAIWFLRFFHEETLITLLTVCVFPFILPDLIKAWLAVILSDRLEKTGALK